MEEDPIKTVEEKRVEAIERLKAFQKDIAEVVNRHGIDSQMNVPDYILAVFMTDSLAAVYTLNHNYAVHLTPTAPPDDDQKADPT